MPAEGPAERPAEGLSAGSADGRGPRLTPDEDQELRRLHWFEALGCELSSAMRTLKEGIRSRDRRAEIREPGAMYNQAAAESLRAQQDSPRYWADRETGR